MSATYYNMGRDPDSLIYDADRNLYKVYRLTEDERRDLGSQYIWWRIDYDYILDNAYSLRMLPAGEFHAWEAKTAYVRQMTETDQRVEAHLRANHSREAT